MLTPENVDNINSTVEMTVRWQLEEWQRIEKLNVQVIALLQDLRRKTPRWNGDLMADVKTYYTDPANSFRFLEIHRRQLPDIQLIIKISTYMTIRESEFVKQLPANHRINAELTTTYNQLTRSIPMLQSQYDSEYNRDLARINFCCALHKALEDRAAAAEQFSFHARMASYIVLSIIVSGILSELARGHISHRHEDANITASSRHNFPFHTLHMIFTICCILGVVSRVVPLITDFWQRPSAAPPSPYSTVASTRPLRAPT